MKLDATALKRMIKEAVDSMLGEDYGMDEAGEGLRGRLAAKAGAPGDQISIDKLIMSLDGMEKSGKTTITNPELQQVAKKSLDLSGTGAVAKATPGAQASFLQKATSPTGGAPVRKPFESKERGMVSISEAELKEMVSTVVKAKLTESMGNNPIMAKREIIALMDSTARNFETEIVKTFRLQDPDMLSSELQRRYLEIVEDMKGKMVAAAMDAVRQLITFPKQDEGNGGMKQ